MNIFDTLGQAAAQIELAIAQQLGYQMSFQHRSGSGANVWVRVIQRDTNNVIEGGMLTSARDVVLIIATGQPGFVKPMGDAEPVIAGDQFFDTENKRTYSVVTNGIKSNKYNTVFTLVCTAHKTISAGGQK